MWIRNRRGVYNFKSKTTRGTVASKIKKLVLAADSKGLDGQTSALEPDSSSANVLQNYEQSVGNSFRGRVGCQTSGAYGFFAMFPHRYTRTEDQYDLVYQTAAGTYPNQTPSLATTKTTADGASIEKLIALNQQVWVLDTMNITVTYVSGTYPFTWYSYVNGSNINFCIKANGSSILDTSLGDGISSSTSIWSLLSSIDGLAQLAVNRTTRGTCPPFAIVNGGQTTSLVGSADYGNRYSVTVDSGHNFSAGDIITFIVSGVLYGGIVVATTNTSITYVGPQLTLTDDQVLGYMAQAATMFPIDVAQSDSSGNFTFSFPYWRLIPEGDGSFSTTSASGFGYGFPNAIARTTWLNRSTGSFYAPPTYTNQLGNLYFTTSSSTQFTGTLLGTWCNNLMALDGLQPRVVGAPSRVNTTGAPRMVIGTNANGNLTGTYRYKAFIRRYDGQGNVWDGPLSEVKTGTYASDAGDIAVDLLNTYANGSGRLVRSCIKRTTESPAAGAAFYVESDPTTATVQAFIQPGDVICLTDNTAQKTGLWTNNALSTPLGTLHVTRCTAYSAQATTISPTASSIRVEDSSGYQINNNTQISTGLTVVVVRTTNGGVDYYVLCEVPVNGYLGGVTFYDDVTDTVLEAGELYTEVEVGKEHDNPPPCTLVCEHNGGLVVARGPTTPNQVSVSTAEGLEYFPTASNSFDVPSTQSGFITAIASDANDRLAVFKDRAYYDVVGDVDLGNFSVNVRNEGDYGIASQASLVRLPIGLCGLSKNGFVVISDGLLDPFRFGEVNARIVNQSYQFSWATAVNDSFNRNYLCTIPQVSGEPIGYSIDYSRPIIKIFDREYPTQIDQAGGGAMVGDTLYHLSSTSPYGVFRRLRRFSGNSPSGNGDGDSFIDNTNAIEYIWEHVPLHLDAPGQVKSAIRGRLWSIPNDYVVEGWVPFPVLVETGASCFSQYIGSAFPGGTSTTLTFTSGIAHLDFKLTRQATHFYMMRFTTNLIRTSPFITGFGILFAENYLNEDFINK